MSNQRTESVLRKVLKNEGYKLSRRLKMGETGADIIASKDGKEWHIEVIGFKKSPPARSKDFYEVFFRAISRLKDGAKYIVIALPERFCNGLPQRARQYGTGWHRIGVAFPELKIWLVDTKKKSYQKTPWNSWLEN